MQNGIDDTTKIITILRGSANVEVWQSVVNQEATDIYKSYLIDETTEIESQEAVLSIGGVEVMHRGDVSAIQGQVKAGKSAGAALLAAAVLSPVPGAVVPGAATAIEGAPSVLYFDTEQSTFYAKFHHARIVEAATAGGVEADTITPNLKYIGAKAAHPYQRRYMLYQAIKSLRPDLVVVDGVSDLMLDTNDNMESSEVVQILNTLADTFGCHICAVIHQNTGSLKARGHIGSELWRKCETIIDCKKTETGGGDPFFTLSFPITRGRQPHNIDFERVGDNGTPRVTHRPTPEEAVSEVVKATFADGRPFTCKEAAAALLAAGYDFTQKTVQRWLSVICKTERGERNSIVYKLE